MIFFFKNDKLSREYLDKENLKKKKKYDTFDFFLMYLLLLFNKIQIQICQTKR